MHTLSVQDIHPTASRRLTLSVLGPYLTKIECGLGGIHKLLFEECLQLDSLCVRSLQQSKSSHANPQTRTLVSAMRAQNNSKVSNPDSKCLCSHTDTPNRDMVMLYGMRPMISPAAMSADANNALPPAPSSSILIYVST